LFQRSELQDGPNSSMVVRPGPDIGHSNLVNFIGTEVALIQTE